MSSQLLNLEQRNKRVLEKRDAILKFLRDETWTTAGIIQQLLRFKSIQAAHQTLNKLVRDGYLNKAKLNFIGKDIVLFGITNHGLAFAWDLDEELEKRPTFQPSKITLTCLPHKIELQSLRIKALQNGWKNWVPGERLGILSKLSKRPDAIATSPDNVKCAIEVERNVKSQKRYKEILVAHLLAIKHGHYEKVVYLSETNSLSKRIERSFLAIAEVKYNGAAVKLNAAHFSSLRFVTYEHFI